MANAYKILNREIPFGGFGRKLTSSELKALRAEGIRGLSNDSIVVQQGSAEFGQVYIPSKPSGYGSTDIFVGRK